MHFFYSNSLSVLIQLAIIGKASRIILFGADGGCRESSDSTYYRDDEYLKLPDYFVAFSLKQYVEEGVGELDDQKLPALIELKYNTITDGISVLGEDIRERFINFQQHLYAA